MAQITRKDVLTLCSKLNLQHESLKGNLYRFHSAYAHGGQLLSPIGGLSPSRSVAWLQGYEAAQPKTVKMCFGCEKKPMKYVDGLCERCHQIALSVPKCTHPPHRRGSKGAARSGRKPTQVCLQCGKANP